MWNVLESEVGPCATHARVDPGRIGTVDGDQQADLQEVLSLDDTNRILELTSKMRGGMSL